MIPREILKKIRQIEPRTNRIVTESVDRGCVQSTSRSSPDFSNAPANHVADGARASARFTARTTGASNPNSLPNPVRRLKRRERRAPTLPALRLGLRPQPRSIHSAFL